LIVGVGMWAFASTVRGWAIASPLAMGLHGGWLDDRVDFVFDLFHGVFDLVQAGFDPLRPHAE
jgi:hypothetical protein